MKKRYLSFSTNDPQSRTLRKIRNDLTLMRNTTRRPDLLEWQIRLYDFILAKPNPDEATEEYLRSVARGSLLETVIERDARLRRAALAMGFQEPMP